MTTCVSLIEAAYKDAKRHILSGNGSVLTCFGGYAFTWLFNGYVTNINQIIAQTNQCACKGTSGYSKCGVCDRTHTGNRATPIGIFDCEPAFSLCQGCNIYGAIKCYQIDAETLLWKAGKAIIIRHNKSYVEYFVNYTGAFYIPQLNASAYHIHDILDMKRAMNCIAACCNGGLPSDVTRIILALMNELDDFDMGGDTIWC